MEAVRAGAALRRRRDRAEADVWRCWGHRQGSRFDVHGNLERIGTGLDDLKRVSARREPTLRSQDEVGRPEGSADRQHRDIERHIQALAVRGSIPMPIRTMATAAHA